MDIEPTCVNLFRSAWLWNAESLQNDEETHNDKVKTVIANLYGPDFFFFNHLISKVGDHVFSRAGHWNLVAIAK